MSLKRLGFNDRTVQINKSGDTIYEYKLWNQVRSRCFSKSHQAKDVSYIGCSISDNFLNFTFFFNWCNNQIGFGNEGWELDKDILVKGNKIYSEDTCCFVPSELNKLLLSHRRGRGEHPIGVSYCKLNKRFRASVRKDMKKKTLGYYSTAEEAFYAYKQAKEAHIKEVANKWKDQVDIRVYEALMKYEVEIMD